MNKKKLSSRNFNLYLGSFLLLVCVLMVAGCNKTNEVINNVQDEEFEEKEELENKPTIQEIIEMYSPDELGDIPIIMYHAVCDNPPSVYQRSVEGFKEDLLYMYEHNYRPISASDFVNFNIKTPAGTTPILLTFDDGDYRSFALQRTENGELVPEENCAVYLMEEFYNEHPDFGKNAIFFINGHNGTFLGNDKTITLEERINWLFEHGYEVSNHTDGHINIKNSTGEEIQKNLAIVDKLIKEINSNAVLDIVAYPFGAKPTEENQKYIFNGTYNGYEYTYKIGLREGPSKARFYPVIHIEFEPLNTPRLRGNKGEVGDMYSYFESYEKNPSLRFVSDGDPNIITIPSSKEDKINNQLDIIKGKEIILY